jgi:transposase-like protein
MEKKDRRGAKPKFSPEERAYLANLIRQHGIRGAQRNASMPVCQKTLASIAREFGIQFAKGRRPKAAA